MLPKNMQKAIKNYEKYGKNPEEFKIASKEFYRRFVRRFDKPPRAFQRSNEKENAELYTYMWGPKEFWSTGTLKNLNLENKLKKITIPVLLICGRYDESTPQSNKHFKKMFQNATMKIFDKSAHLPFWNQRKEFNLTVKGFLDKLEN